MKQKDFLNLLETVIDSSRKSGSCTLNTPHAESYTERRDMYYMGVDWLDLYIKERKVFKNFVKKILNLKNLILGYLEPDPRKKEIRFLTYLLKKHELKHVFFASIIDISIIKREMAEKMAYEETLKLQDPYDSSPFNEDYEEVSKNIFVLTGDTIKKAKELNRLTEEFFEKITYEEVIEELESNCVHYFDGVYICKDWDTWVIDSAIVPFDMQNGWSFDKLSEIVSKLLSSLLLYELSVKISNE